jgi:hypothetical protein
MTSQDLYRTGCRLLHTAQRIKPNMDLVTGHAVYVTKAGTAVMVRLESLSPLTGVLSVAQRMFDRHIVNVFLQDRSLEMEEGRRLWEMLFEESQKALLGEE